MSSRCKTFSPSSVGASTRKGTWWGCSARPAFGRASPNGSSLGASSCQEISSRRWRPCPGKTVGDGSPIARSLGARDRDLRRGHAGHIGPRAAVAVVDRTEAAEKCGGAAAFVRGTEQRRPGGVADPDSRCRKRRDRKSTRLNSSHSQISYAVFCLKKKKAPSGDHPTLPPAPARVR